MALLVQDVMETDPLIIDIDCSVFRLRELIVVRQPESVLVRKNSSNAFAGIINSSDFAAITEADLDDHVESVMETDVPTIRKERTLQEAAALISSSHLEALPVVDENGIIKGLLSYRDLIKDIVKIEPLQDLTPESSAIFLAMTKDAEQEEYWLQKVTRAGFKAAITQVGANAEKLPIKLREAAVVSSIARSVIKEDPCEKMAVSAAVRDVYLQCHIINPGLGGGFKVVIVRGDRRITVAAFGRCGHSLSNGTEQIFVGSNII